MKNLQKYFNLCVSNLEAINIPVAKNISYKVNSRARSRWGQCKQQDGRYIIEISNLLLDGRCPEESLLNTIYHELLHTCEGCMNHGKTWKKYATKVLTSYGVNITRVSSVQEKLGDSTFCAEVIKERQAKRKSYCVECSVCHTKCIYHKRINVGNYVCGKCHTHTLMIFEI